MITSIQSVVTEHGKAAKCYLLSSSIQAVPHCTGNKIMSSETFSVIAWFSHDQLTNATQLKVVRVDTSEEVHLNEGSFLLRISRDENTSVIRCHIRHLNSGREAYIQSGEGIRAFIEASLLKNQNAGEPPEKTGAE